MLRFSTVLLALLIPAAVDAAGFSDLIVFGDSLSDVGNTGASTFGIFPGSEYFNGRFSNGPVYAEVLSESLGFGPLARSGEGGDNFAFGGAETAGPGGFAGLFLDDLGEQVEEYTTEREVDPNALHIVWAGANDLLAEQLDFEIPASNIAGELTTLHAAGARRFLVINLPDLGATPRFNTNELVSIDYTNRTNAFNAALERALDGVETTLSGIDLLRFDVNAVFDDLLTNPTSLGLTNTTDAALDVGAENPDEFLFFDDLHPTAVVHQRLADEVLTLLSDANRDGTVNAADFVVLRDAGANASAQLAAFRGAFEAPAPNTTVISVPEPIAAVPLLTALAMFAPVRRLTRG